jgi:hypothetical protein
MNVFTVNSQSVLESHLIYIYIFVKIFRGKVSQNLISQQGCGEVGGWI